MRKIFNKMKEALQEPKQTLEEEIKQKIEELERARLSYKLKQIAYESEVACTERSLSMLKTELLLLPSSTKL